MLTPDRWERVKDLFDRALDSAPGARVGLLEAECSNDPEVFAEVQRLLEQWESAGEFLANPIGELSVPTPPNAPGFSAGDLVAQRFRIVRLIGAGGMGEVYEAEDQDLGERVALKTVRIDRIGDPLAQRRLRREALLARRVTHPNVCRIFDVGRHVSSADGAELAVLSMELLEGQTLAARLKERGRLSEAEALPIVEQMCAALEAAHVAGIVHRDFKPSNVMLVGDRVVVTDFGLALADPRANAARLPSGTTLTHSGQLMGTPEYMAPEQIRTGEATPRSDIYSLGVVMYEMVTGVRPAAGSTGIEEILKRFLEPVRPPREIVAGLSRRWEAVILRCLEREAGARWGSAAEVAKGLGGGAWLPTRSSRRAAVGILGAVAAAGTGVSLFPKWSRFLTQNRIELAPGTKVLLTGITNSTSEPALNGITQLLRVQLDQSSRLNPVDERHLLPIWPQIGKTAASAVEASAVRQAAWHGQIPVVIFGAISSVGGDYALSLTFEVRGVSPEMPTRSEVGNFRSRGRTGLMQTAREASHWIRNLAGESAELIAKADRLPEDVSTPSWEAMRFYAQADHYGLTQRLSDAVLMLDAALDRDPGFTLASMRRGDLLMSLDRPHEGLLEWQRALKLLNGRRVTRREELRTRGMYAFDSGDFTAAGSYFAQLALEFPHDWRGWYYQTLPLYYADQVPSAIRVLEQASRLEPSYPTLHAYLADCHIQRRDWQKAANEIAQLRQRGEIERPATKEAMMRFCQGEVGQALDGFRGLAQDRNDSMAARGHLNLAIAELELGRFDDAIRSAHAGLGRATLAEQQPLRNRLQLQTAWTAYLAGQSDRARRVLSDVVRVLEIPAQKRLAGVLLARLNQLSDARRLLDAPAGLGDSPTYRRLAQIVESECLLQEGKREAALAMLRDHDGNTPRLFYRSSLSIAAGADGAAHHQYAAECPFSIWRTDEAELPGAWRMAARQSARGSAELQRIRAQFS